MNLFESVKEAVPMRSAAEHFGIRVGRGGMACCPFHNDRTPSMKLNDDYFYCFGCGASGDVITLAARLTGRSPRQAAEGLARDFGVSCAGGAGEPSQGPVRRSELLRYQQAEQRCYRILCRCWHILMNWKERYAPLPGETDWHPLYCEAIAHETRLEYILDEVFLGGTPGDRAEFIKNHGKEVVELGRRLQELDAGDQADHG